MNNLHQPARPEANDQPSSAAPLSSSIPKMLIGLGVACLGGYLFYAFGGAFDLQSLAAREAELREYQANHPWIVFGAAFLIYVVATGFSIPGAAALTLALGWYFGFFRGVVLVSFASTLGATVAFTMSRFFLGEWVQLRFGEKLRTVNESFEREGGFYLFTLRLIPLMPFFLVNLLMGLTKIKTRSYWWISQLGMFPATCVYVYAGSRVPNLTVLAEKGPSAVFSPTQLLQLTFAFALLGLFPLAVKKILGYIRPQAGQLDSSRED